MTNFKELGIAEPILRAIEDEGFTEPTRIQVEAIPLVLEGNDVVGASKTGSGKTLAFSAGIVQECEPGRGIQALVLTPTRELAQQVADRIATLSKYKEIKTAIIHGGVDIGPQIKALKSADIVVATPGRLLDHLGRKTVDLGGVQTLILDEADRMLDMGFIDDVDKIIGKCPPHRQTLLFSATMSTGIDKLSEKYLKNPIDIFVESNVDPSKLTQIYYDVHDGIKFSLLVHLLKGEKSGLVMVFCNTRRGTDFVARNLKNQGIKAMAVHGGLSQNKRDEIMENFHSGEVFVLVCTDVAARGLDIEGVSHVYNYDIPNDPKQYTHRIGRTARAGKDGKAVNILSSRDHDNFRRVMRYHSQHINREKVPYVERVDLKRSKNK